MPTKQVIVWRNDLQCRLGKKMAQAGHAASAFLMEKMIENLDGEKLIGVSLNEYELDYLKGNFRKVVVRVDSEQQLMDVYEKAKSLNLTVHLITDEGLTEFDGPTKTCLAIGPDDEGKINQVTGNLKLL